MNATITDYRPFGYTLDQQAAHRKQLVADLRSGDFKQTQYRLKKPDGMCCLGVACERFHEDTGRGHWEVSETDPDAASLFISGSTELTFMPQEVADYFGFNSTNGIFTERVVIERYKGTISGGRDGSFASLYAMNDVGATFEEIADVIEKPQPGLVRE